MDIAGVIWRTTNSGINWQVYCVSPEPMNDIVFNNGRVVAVGGDYEYGSMAVTGFNSGVTWEYSPTGCFGIAQTVSFRTPSEACTRLVIPGCGQSAEILQNLIHGTASERRTVLHLQCIF